MGAKLKPGQRKRHEDQTDEQKYHLGARAKGGVTRTVAGWRDLAPDLFPLPHPSWRNTAWLKKNPWFEAELLPVLRARVKEVMA